MVSTGLREIEIFRAGSHVDHAGRRLTFSHDDVAAIAASYDPAAFAAPIVVGHPKTNDPAFGWVKGLKLRADGVLTAEPEKLEPAFAEAVRSGRYRKVSASFYLPDHPGNPTPGHYYLRHVGFLGASAPAVKGLAPVELDEKEEKVVTVEFSGVLRDAPLRGAPQDEGRSAIGRFLANLAELVGGGDFAEMRKGEAGEGTGGAVRAEIKRLTDGGMTLVAISEALGRISEDASRAPSILAAIRGGEIANPPDSLLAALKTIKAPAKTTDNSETEEDALSAEEKTRLAALEAENAALKKKAASFAEAEKASQKKDDETFLAGLVKEGKLAPGLKADLAAFMEGLDGEKTVSFSEGEKPLRAFFRALLEKSGTVIDLSERSAGAGDEGQKPVALEERMAAQFKKEAK